MNSYADSDCDCNYDCDTCIDEPDECNEQYIRIERKDGE
jgi:hypothetical protein